MSLLKYSCSRANSMRCVLEDEYTVYLEGLHDWKIVEGKLQKVILFSSYQDAFKFVSKVVTLSDKENHHPDILLAWGKVEIKIHTHMINKLSLSDFILATKIDEIINMN